MKELGSTFIGGLRMVLDNRKLRDVHYSRRYQEFWDNVSSNQGPKL